MSISIEEFSKRCQLIAEETEALRDILGNKSIMAIAEKIAENCFYPEDSKDIPEYPECDDLSRAWFAACYLAAESAEKHYIRRKYPMETLFESMTDLGIWLRNTKRNYGVIGLSANCRIWQKSIFTGAVIRLGRLECNSEHYYNKDSLRDENGNIILQSGDAVINMHIPEDGPMDIDECKKSMQRMREFFARYRPDYNWKGFLCESWLLDRQLRDMLDAESNILKFQDLGYNYDIGEYEGTIFRVFGTVPPEKVQNPNRLQRNMISFIKSGGKFRCGGLFIPR